MTTHKGLKFKHEYYPAGKSLPKKVEGVILRTPNSKGCVLGSSRTFKDWMAELLLCGHTVEFDGHETTRRGSTGYARFLVEGKLHYFGEKFILDENKNYVKRWNGQNWINE
jgi:hypothetical protein